MDRKHALFAKYTTSLICAIGAWIGFLALIRHFLGENMILLVGSVPLALLLLWNIWKYAEAKANLESYK